MLKQLAGENNTYYNHSLCSIPAPAFVLEDSFHICMVLEGRCQIQYNAMNRQLKANDLFFFPANTPYALYDLAGNTLIYRIRIFPGFFREFCSNLTDLGYDIFHIPANTHDSVYRQLCHMLADMVFSGISDSAGTPLRQLTVVSQLLLILSEQFGSTAPRAAIANDYIQERITDALEYMSKHYTEKISLEEISQSLGLHPQYFSTFFKKHLGMGFVDYLNLYRVNQSLYALGHTARSITEIAMACGFQSHKSYCTAFRKYYGMLPSTFRGQLTHPAPNRLTHPNSVALDQVTTDSKRASELPGQTHHLAQKAPESHISGDNVPALSHFQYLRAYWKQSETIPEMPRQKSLFMEMDLTQAHTIISDRRMRILSIGCGHFLLQKTVLEQFQKAVAQCRFTHIHFRDVFSDLMTVYTDPGMDEPIFHWETLDRIIEIILQSGMYPFIEIGYMPRDLASSRWELGFGSHPNVSPPRSALRWKQLIKAFLNHYKTVYGLETLRQWRFDFWNSANIQFDNGYWPGSREQFFELYRWTYEAFMDVDRQLSLGSPNFSLPAGMDWYEAFFDFCIQNKMKPAFLSLHMYSCMDHMDDNPGIFPYPPTTYNYLSLTNTEYTRNILRFLKDMLKKHHMDDLPLIATDWNITFYLLDLIRDTAFMAPYIIHTHLLTMELIEGLAYFTLSDINDQARPSFLRFPGGCGLIDSHSIPKPAYNAFVLLHKLDKDVIANTPPCIITRSDRGYHILIYNLAGYDNDLKKSNLEFMSDVHRYQVFEETDTLAFHGIFKVGQGNYTIRKYSIDREHGSAFDAWQKMGSPKALDEEICHFLRAAAEPEFRWEQQENTETLTLEGTIAPHGVLLFEIERG